MTILLGALRTGYHPDSKVFEYREPSNVLGTLISNNLASIVISPKEIEELIILTNDKFDEAFYEHISDFCEISQERIVMKENFSIVDWLSQPLSQNHLCIVSALNRARDDLLINYKVHEHDEISTLPEEKVGIEISNSIEQKSLWYEDVTVIPRPEHVLETNGGGSLIFTKDSDFRMHEVPMYKVSILAQLQLDNLNTEGNIQNILSKLDFNYDWPVEFDYLDTKQYEMLQDLLYKRYSAFLRTTNSPQLFGNAYVINGFRAINALYHRMNKQKLRNGLVFIEQQEVWTILQLKRVYKEA